MFDSIVASATTDAIDAIITAAAGLFGAAVGGWVTWKVSGPYWERAKLSAVGPLIEARLPAYQTLWKLTDYGPEESPSQLTPVQRRDLAEQIRAWYYKDGAGLLMSDGARRQWTAVQEQLLDDAVDGQAMRRAMSCLRTRLKQDVHVHDPDIDDRDCRDQPNWEPSRQEARTA